MEIEIEEFSVEELTVKLVKPVTVDGITHDTLVLRELTVDENIALERSAAGRGALEQDKYFFAKSCHVSPEVIGSLCGRDWNRLRTRYWSTLGKLEPEPESSE